MGTHRQAAHGAIEAQRVGIVVGPVVPAVAGTLLDARMSDGDMPPPG